MHKYYLFFKYREMQAVNLRQSCFSGALVNSPGIFQLVSREVKLCHAFVIAKLLNACSSGSCQLSPLLCLYDPFGATTGLGTYSTAWALVSQDADLNHSEWSLEMEFLPHPDLCVLCTALCPGNLQRSSGKQQKHYEAELLFS